MPDAEARIDRYSVVPCEVQERIEAALAHTLAGLKVKARYALCLDDESSKIPDALMGGIIRDLLAPES